MHFAIASSPLAATSTCHNPVNTKIKFPGLLNHLPQQGF